MKPVDPYPVTPEEVKEEPQPVEPPVTNPDPEVTTADGPGGTDPAHPHGTKHP